MEDVGMLESGVLVDICARRWYSITLSLPRKSGDECFGVVFSAWVKRVETHRRYKTRVASGAGTCINAHFLLHLKMNSGVCYTQKYGFILQHIYLNIQCMHVYMPTSTRCVYICTEISVYSVW